MVMKEARPSISPVIPERVTIGRIVALADKLGGAGYLTLNELFSAREDYLIARSSIGKKYLGELRRLKTLIWEHTPQSPHEINISSVFNRNIYTIDGVHIVFPDAYVNVQMMWLLKGDKLTINFGANKDGIERSNIEKKRRIKLETEFLADKFNLNLRFQEDQEQYNRVWVDVPEDLKVQMLI